jgi:predicted metal-dependent HD superfamily phosphohydrolase
MMPKYDIPETTILFDAYCYGLGGYREASAGGAIETCFNALVHAWSEPHRVYHSFTHHLVPLVSQITDAGLEGAFENELNFRSTLVAAFYHDYIYRLDQPDAQNVIQSEQRWNDDARLIYGDGLRDTDTYSFVQAVASEIATTDYANRENFNRGSDEWLREDVSLIDFDLGNLCAHPSTYMLHRDKIRREWVHVSDTDFNRGRMAFLKLFLALPRLYHPSMDGSETKARANMGSELARLLVEEDSQPAKPCCSNPSHFTTDGDAMPCGHRFNTDGDIVPDRVR